MPQRVRKMARAIGAVVQRGVNHALVHAVPENAARAVHHRLDEQNRIEFINVIFIENCVIKAAESVRDFVGKLRAQIVENRRHDETQQGSKNRNSGKEQVSRAAGLRLGPFCLLLRRPELARRHMLCVQRRRRGMKHRRQKLVEVIAATHRSGNSNPTTNDR